MRYGAKLFVCLLLADNSLSGRFGTDRVYETLGD